MARTQAAAGLSVYQIFNLCQKSNAAHAKCVGLLWQLERSNSEKCLADILNCFKHVLLIPQGEMNGERVVRFITGFVAGRDPAREEDCDTFAEKLLRQLINLVTARDKSVRTRCCQLVQVIFNNLRADELDEDLLDSMQESMLERLADKVPAVRTQAVSALPRLCDPGD
ncbi:MAG: condensin complex non-smc subunit, partial [Trebouxia sp. A1-2]